jgi:hypothetical protein
MHVGVSKLDLCLPDCTWLTSHTEDLYPFDAGVDSGISYNVNILSLILQLIITLLKNQLSHLIAQQIH